MGLETFDIDLYSFFNIFEGFFEGIPFAMASHQGRTEDMITSIRLPFQDDRVSERFHCTARLPVLPIFSNQFGGVWRGDDKGGNRRPFMSTRG